MKQAIADAISALNPAIVAFLRAECQAKHKQYKAMEYFCESCDRGRGRTCWERISRCAHSAANLACWTSVVTLRTEYLISGCDFILNDDWSGHINELKRKASAAGWCAKSAALNCNNISGIGL